MKNIEEIITLLNKQAAKSDMMMKHGAAVINGNSVITYGYNFWLKGQCGYCACRSQCNE